MMGASFCVLRKLTTTTLAVSLVILPTTSWAGPPAASETDTEPASEPEPAVSDQADPATAEEPSEVTAEAPEPEPTPSAQTDRQQAAELFFEGTKYYELGQYPEAIDHFQRAWELAPEPQLLYNLGQAHWKWFDVDPDIDHLRRARTFFQNYDKRMRSLEGYSSAEVDGFIRAISAQIEAEEQKKAERERPVIMGPSIAEQEAAERRAYERQRQLRVTKGLNISGITFLALGGVSLAVGLGGLLTRQANKVILDTTSGGDPGEPNIASVEEDERRRRAYELGGQIAFGGFVGAAALLPVGITLRVWGGLRERRQGATPATEPTTARNEKVSAELGHQLLIVHF